MRADQAQPEGRGTGRRLLILDLARSTALLGMVIFHLTWDLAFLGFIAPDVPVSGFFWYFARIVAGSFIFLAGMGLWLSHGEGVRGEAFLRRFAKIAAAAALISLATYFALPDVWIFYGILHSIAVSSLLGLLVLRLPVAAILALAAFVFWLPWNYADPAFGGWLIWTGLSGMIPATLDFEPLFPWFAPFLAGMALARLCGGFDLWRRIEPRSNRFLRALAWPGRHSLVIYLIHQPLLIGLLSSYAMLLSR